MAEACCQTETDPETGVEIRWCTVCDKYTHSNCSPRFQYREGGDNPTVGPTPAGNALPPPGNNTRPPVVVPVLSTLANRFCSLRNHSADNEASLKERSLSNQEIMSTSLGGQ
jgi:hypothetical protein